jgi:G:T-mismatch repair DNA endonuclease (very short patch repair protein)
MPDSLEWNEIALALQIRQSCVLNEAGHTPSGAINGKQVVIYWHGLSWQHHDICVPAFRDQFHWQSARTRNNFALTRVVYNATQFQLSSRATSHRRLCRRDTFNAFLVPHTRIRQSFCVCKVLNRIHILGELDFELKKFILRCMHN